MSEINELVGKTLDRIIILNDKSEINFYCTDGISYSMLHHQDCCESVYVDDIVGDIKDLIDTPILEAREDTNQNDPKQDDTNDSFTWTFYNIRTINGSVTIKWYGTSNGYYSESVSFDQVESEKIN
jgi:hypothetical protein